MSKRNNLNQPIALTIALFVVLLFSPLLFTTSAYNPFVSTADKVSQQTTRAGVSASYDVLFSSSHAFNVRDIHIGGGAAVEAGDTVYVHYVGMLEDGTIFDNSTYNNKPFIATIGTEEIIQGWDIGLRGMQVGGTRRLVIPPALAYGNQSVIDGNGHEMIPANSTLIFDVVLVKVDEHD